LPASGIDSVVAGEIPSAPSIDFPSGKSSKFQVPEFHVKDSEVFNLELGTWNSGTWNF
jgi:hypothetical protein